MPKIIYQGEPYESLKDLADHIGLNSEILKYRIKNWPEKDWSKVAIKEGTPTTNIEITYGEEIFPSIKELAKHLGVDHHTLGYRLKQGWPQKDWSLPAKSKKNTGPAREINYQGKSVHQPNSKFVDGFFFSEIFDDFNLLDFLL